MAPGLKIGVVGIGTVEIPVKRRYSEGGNKHGIIRIDNVLHVPTTDFNILGCGDFTSRYMILRKSVNDLNGRDIGYFDDAKELCCLKLSGPPVGSLTTPSQLLKANQEPDVSHHVNACWPESESRFLIPKTVSGWIS